jgi:hypothetical protein
MATTTDTLQAEIRKTIAEWQRTIAALPDLLDLPGSLSDRQKGVERERRVRLQQHLTSLTDVSEQLTAAATTRATVTPQRDRLRAARSTIEKQIEDAPDQWERQEELRASLTAIDRGVGYFNARPALPAPLRALLTDTCTSCGHSELSWSGPLPDLEDKVAEAERQIALAPGSLASLRQSIQPWLGEPVTS